jgi:hypothetical protein
MADKIKQYTQADIDADPNLERFASPMILTINGKVVKDDGTLEDDTPEGDKPTEDASTMTPQQRLQRFLHRRQSRGVRPHR